MPITKDELAEIFEKYLRFEIDISQGMSYCMNSKYEQGMENFLKSIKTLQDIINKIKD